MTARALFSELVVAAKTLSAAQAAFLGRLGITPAAAFRAGLLGAAEIIPDGGLFGVAADGADEGADEPGAGGAVIQGVFTGPVPLDATDDFAEGRLATLYDLLAWDARAPGRWWRRQGIADWLGEGAVIAAGRTGAALRLYPTPLAWLRAGCPDDGAVRLSPVHGLACGCQPPGPDAPYLRDELWGVGELILPPGDAEFAGLVHKALRRRAKAPKIPAVMIDDAGAQEAAA